MPRATPPRGVGDDPVAEEGVESARAEAAIVQFQSRHVVCGIDRFHGERHAAADGDLEGDIEGVVRSRRNWVHCHQLPVHIERDVIVAVCPHNCLQLLRGRAHVPGSCEEKESGNGEDGLLDSAHYQLVVITGSIYILTLPLCACVSTAHAFCALSTTLTSVVKPGVYDYALLGICVLCMKDK